MNCKNCGREIEEGAVFCTNCGTKVEYTAPAAEERTAVPEEAQPSISGIYEKTEPVQPVVPPVVNETAGKVDFGKGALAFCLVVIGILAISTGVFAGLYFSLV